MRSGTLNHVLTYQTKPVEASASEDANGQEVEVWSDVATYRASLKPLSGRELANALALRNDVTHEIRTRYFGTVNPALARWKLESRIFNIISAINVDDARREMIYICTEVVSNP